MFSCASLSNALGLVEVEASRAGGAGDLHLEVGPRDASATVALRQGDVVHRPHGPDLDALVGRHFCSDVEIHDVAFVVAVDVEHALAAMDRLRRFEDDLGRRRGEYVPAGRGGRKSGPDIGRVDRLVAASASDQEGDFSVLDMRPHERADTGDFRQPSMRRENDALDDFVDDSLRIVDRLLRHDLFPPSLRASTPHAEVDDHAALFCTIFEARQMVEDHEQDETDQENGKREYVNEEQERLAQHHDPENDEKRSPRCKVSK